MALDAEDASLVYGLELSARCLCNQAAETNTSRYIVGSQSLQQENQVHVLEYDDESNQLEKYVFSHAPGEIWHLGSCYTDPSIFSSCYNQFIDGQIHHKCAIWKLPMEGDSMKYNENFNSNQASPMTQVAELKSSEVPIVRSAFWKPVESENQVMTFDNELTIHLWDIDDGEPTYNSSFNIGDSRKYHSPVVTNGRWNPHHGAKQFALSVASNIISWDIRSNTSAFVLENAHKDTVRDLDFNPNKQYTMLSCGDDCMVKFWDIRELKSPISEIKDEHLHWIWSARFNPFHDQLILSCSSDSKVVLYNKLSVSSEQYQRYSDGDDEDDLGEKDGSDQSDNGKQTTEDGLLSVFDEHEDSVYAVEWSAAEPWSFASLSYDGRVVINKVPKDVKFDILL